MEYQFLGEQGEQQHFCMGLGSDMFDFVQMKIKFVQLECLDNFDSNFDSLFILYCDCDLDIDVFYCSFEFLAITLDLAVALFFFYLIWKMLKYTRFARGLNARIMPPYVG